MAADDVVAADDDDDDAAVVDDEKNQIRPRSKWKPIRSYIIPNWQGAVLTQAEGICGSSPTRT